VAGRWQLQEVHPDTSGAGTVCVATALFLGCIVAHVCQPEMHAADALKVLLRWSLGMICTRGLSVTRTAVLSFAQEYCQYLHKSTVSNKDRSVV
jgi:hypothetical protein